MESKCIVNVLCGRKKDEKCLYQEKNRGKKDNNDCGQGWYDRFGTCNSDEASAAALIAALKKLGYMEELGGGWQPIETAPYDGDILIYQPKMPYKPGSKVIFESRIELWRGGRDKALIKEKIEMGYTLFLSIYNPKE